MRHLALALALTACGAARDSAADTAGAPAITVTDGPVLSPIDVTAEEAIDGVVLPGLLVVVHGCTGATTSAEGSCWPTEWDVIGGRTYPRSGAVSYRLWTLR
jgi:hypothetical protein